MVPFLKYAAKAFANALAIVIASLLMILTDGKNLADVTFVQWLWIAGLILGSWGFVYAVPNGAKPGAHAAE